MLLNALRNCFAPGSLQLTLQHQFFYTAEALEGLRPSFHTMYAGATYGAIGETLKVVVLCLSKLRAPVC